MEDHKAYSTKAVNGYRYHTYFVSADCIDEGRRGYDYFKVIPQKRMIDHNGRPYYRYSKAYYVFTTKAEAQKFCAGMPAAEAYTERD